jgi:GNAT superfamily N-acetyltransferase
MADKFSFKALDMETWPAFEKLFGPKGACGGCWCMLWRLRKKEFDKGKGDGNRLAIYKLVEDGETPGVLAFYNGEAVGWCAIAPREKYVRLETSRALKAVDDKPVWSVSCFFISKDFRRRGLTLELLKAAKKLARENGAKILEAYPVDSKGKNVPAVFAWTGFVSPFLAAGFREVMRHTPTRPILRCSIK